MSQDSEIFNGGESPLAAQANAASTMSHGQTGATQSDGGSAPNPAEGAAGEPSARTSAGSADPSVGGVMRARS